MMHQNHPREASSRGFFFARRCRAPVLPRLEWGTGQIGPVVGDASAWRDEIVAAIDLLMSGF